MKEIRQRIAEIASIGNGLTLSEVTDKLIEEVVKPLAKEAFEAGSNFEWDTFNYPPKEEWIESTFGVTSNKQ